MILAERYHWTPEQVGRLEPEFIEELIARMRAEADVQQTTERKQRRGQSRQLSGGLVAEDVGLEEIV